MKFDTERAMADVQVFAFPRPAGSEGECYAADLLAARLERAGWRVNRAESRTGCRLITLVMFLLYLLLLDHYSLWKALRLSLPTSSPLARTGWFLLGVVTIAGLVGLTVGRRGARNARERFAAWRSARGRQPRANLIADRPDHQDRAARVLIVSHLDTPLAVAKVEDALFTLVGLGLILGLIGWPLSRATREWFIVGMVTTLVLFLTRYWLRSASPSLADNRTGLALLAELGELLPPRLYERVDVRLAGVCGSSTGQLGAVSLADDLARRQPAKPTLVVNLDAPGLGSELQLVGRGRGLDVARKAAKDLWIPHRVSGWSLAAFDHRPFQFQRIPAVSLTGRRNATRIEPAGLAAAAQLVTEMALRWARQEARETQSATLPKSSQNPG